MAATDNPTGDGADSTTDADASSASDSNAASSSDQTTDAGSDPSGTPAADATTSSLDSATSSSTDDAADSSSASDATTQTDSTAGSSSDTDTPSTPDSDSVSDSSSTADTSTATDSGTAADSSATTDSGAATDSSATTDSGPATDTGTAADSSTATDSGAATDSSATTDSSTATDSSGTSDSNGKTSEEWAEPAAKDGSSTAQAGVASATQNPVPKAGGTAPARPYSVASWLPLVTALAGDVPVAFAQAWNTKESGGNPCAFGNANAKGADGNPLEMGLGQLYNPDNFQALSINAGSWRAYCGSGTQTVTRDLTLDECTSQVNGLIGLIKQCRTAARKFNPGWSETSADFWSLVKLQHALPGLLQGMTAVTTSLGHAPATWAEFRATVVKVTLDTKTMAYATSFAKELDNAQATGAAVNKP